jgi:hypothetical protein
MRGRYGVEIDWSDRGKKFALMEDTERHALVSTRA